jgi:serine/threonine protein kinase/tetratricopeptide (TPR) repeat protein
VTDETKVGDRTHRARLLVEEVRHLPAAEQAAVLRERSGGDPALWSAVESLLTDAASRASDPTIETIAPKIATPPPSIRGYRVLHELGRGGMGIVYLAVRDTDRFKRRVAIKVLKRGMDTEDVLQRFDLERRVLAALNHSGIARLYDAGETDRGLPYFVMEHVEGLPIVEYCDAHRLHIDERLGLFRKVCDAVHHAHQGLVVHRDLKPSNILVTKDGAPKLLDFGIAKVIDPNDGTVQATAPEFRVMTPEYASPEQVRGDVITTASDVYALGVVLYEMLSGHKPYRLENRAQPELERMICEVDPERPSTAVSRVDATALKGAEHDEDGTVTPQSVARAREARPDRVRRSLAGDIDNIVLMAMRKEPERRYASAEQFSEDIRRHLTGLPVIARADTTGYRVAKFVRRHRVGVTVGVLAAVVLAGGVIGTTRGWQRAEEARASAESARTEEARLRSIAADERDRAERRFGQLRTLARTFMFDFHEMVRELDGSDEALDILIENARAYLDALAPEAIDDPELALELAEAYVRLGAMRADTGAYDDAETHLRAALDIQTRLAAARPDDPLIARALAAGPVALGDLRLRAGDPEGALEWYGTALDRHEALAAAAPDDAARQGELATVLAAIGNAWMAAGGAANALVHDERALEIRRMLATDGDPAALLRLADAHLQVGERMLVFDAGTDALTHFARAAEILEELAAASDGVETLAALTRARLGLGAAHVARGEASTALGLLRPLLEETGEDPQRLARAHLLAARASILLEAWDDAELQLARLREIATGGRTPEAFADRRFVAIGHEQLGALRAAQGRTDDAIAEDRAALARFETLAAEDPGDANRQVDLARVLTGLGARLSDAGQRGEALRRLESARALTVALGERMPDDRRIRAHRARTLHQLARLLVALEDGAGALGYAQEAVAIAPEPSPRMLRVLAAAYDLTGDSARAIEVATTALQTADDSIRPALERDLERYRAR